MNWKQYTALAKRTMPNIGTDDKVAMLSMGIAGEAGEIVDFTKKVLFHDHEMDKDILKHEIGDLLWYVANLMRMANLTLDEVLTANIEKLQDRYPDGFSSERSQNRHE